MRCETLGNFHLDERKAYMPLSPMRLRMDTKMNFQPGRDTELPEWMMGVLSAFHIPTPPGQIHENSGRQRRGGGKVGRQNDPEYCLVLDSEGHTSFEYFL